MELDKDTYAVFSWQVKLLFNKRWRQIYNLTSRIVIYSNAYVGISVLKMIVSFPKTKS